MTEDLNGYRVVAVHAHPDDEAISTGGALADLARRGAEVTVITCTLGEQGEVIGDPYQHLVADHSDQLGGFRIGELRRSLRILGAQGSFLGAPGRFRDSGMVGDPAQDNPRAFVNSGAAAVELLAAEFERLRPHLVITYGPDGGYGHPDHIRAHEITHLAAAQTGVPRVLWAVTDTADLQAGLASISTVPAGWRAAKPEELASVDSSDLAITLDDHAYHAKRASMQAHATQVWIADGSISEVNPVAAIGSCDGLVLWALSNLIAQPLLRREHYQFGAGVALPEGATGLLDGLSRG
ncbi:1D-myo-inositol 2-acetamido-2-deoxy-alpha-D-glucopyranoside deacetylase [Corynebacterium occultum]|uniref:1D-myo-inositol 2-acetamido-2-deoxy-alpha-D-glucopyranoside deacetylase n=1 Tax=Corynebacterium occultum TaxID=2675219 RepID=A0A6B8WAG0_9CORY|nr:N-acetyl-1-D-myo-inositol-2-amino-2-deoxy-alpha-D-glucopyranoside deacetylase [Corynebacterium occultum]QGU06990.1 1D-myo-inositol 2-acetamido-2-deoxy-alpha-D-glucopyranoside deacetylase [Corynebacterium occultum]